MRRTHEGRKAAGSVAVTFLMMYMLAAIGSATAAAQDVSAPRDASSTAHPDRGPDGQAPDPAPLTPRWITGIARNLFTDLKRLPSKETAIEIGSGGLVALASLGLDHDLTEDVSSSTAATRILEPGSGMGNGWVQGGGAVAVYVFGVIDGYDGIRETGSDLIRAQALNAVLTRAVKGTVRRARPNGPRDSFPSGHASATFATAAVLHRRFGWKVAVPSYLVAVYVSAARLQAGRHFLSDTTFGAALGLASGRTATMGRRRVQVTPIPTSGGAAVLVDVPFR
jgi:PAP2 superfamily protein